MGQNISASSLQRPLINPKEVVLVVCRASHQHLAHNLPLRFAIPFSALTLVGGSSKMCA